FCSYGASFPERLPLRSTTLYPAFATHECFADDRPSRRVWCRDTALQQADEELGSTAQAIESLIHDPQAFARLGAERESMLAACAPVPDPAACLHAAYAKTELAWAAARRAAQATRDQEEAKIAAPGDPARAKRWLQALPGVYKTHFTNGLVDGSAFRSEDILELVPVSADSLYFRVHLEFYNAHTCDLYGIARFSGAGTFVYRDPRPPLPNNSACRLQFAADDREIRIVDSDRSCQAYCGMRGSFVGAAFPRQARRPIRYLDRLKKSTEYQESIAEAH
ncbi:MAG TPA: hypothetical protein VMM92_07255, partial [Thermoanaerobaculia bacterium]|nr:hypothetical protein [Thermoanaerobaculia bacterium]